ncbi:unnamed protein product [Soboliphyme baturini]|uniref:Nuclear pore complex protein Nup214 n=1 Tax=Soboliphyme baturini TaxID=241478 RepID=A0A183ICM4_9BILA|nr:unnamed protein product [Soboliphyme baturini]
MEGNILSVCLNVADMPFVYAYDISKVQIILFYLPVNINLFLQISAKGDPDCRVKLSLKHDIHFVDFKWSPVSTTVFAAVMSDGSAYVVDLGGDKGPNVHGSGSKLTDATCLSDIYWSSTHQFFVLYAAANGSKSVFLLATTTKEGHIYFQSINCLSVDGGCEAISRHYFFRLEDWYSLLCLSTSSSECGVLYWMPKEGRWNHCASEPDKRKLLPRADNGPSAYPIGFDIQKNLKQNLTTGDLELPVIYVLGSDGFVHTFRMAPPLGSVNAAVPMTPVCISDEARKEEPSQSGMNDQAPSTYAPPAPTSPAQTISAQTVPTQALPDKALLVQSGQNRSQKDVETCHVTANVTLLSLLIKARGLVKEINSLNGYPFELPPLLQDGTLQKLADDFRATATSVEKLQQDFAKMQESTGNMRRSSLDSLLWILKLNATSNESNRSRMLDLHRLRPLTPQMEATMAELRNSFCETEKKLNLMQKHCAELKCCGSSSRNAQNLLSSIYNCMIKVESSLKTEERRVQHISDRVESAERKCSKAGVINNNGSGIDIHRTEHDIQTTLPKSSPLDQQTRIAEVVFKTSEMAVTAEPVSVASYPPVVDNSMAPISASSAYNVGAAQAPLPASRKEPVCGVVTLPGSGESCAVVTSDRVARAHAENLKKNTLPATATFQLRAPEPQQSVTNPVTSASVQKSVEQSVTTTVRKKEANVQAVITLVLKSCQCVQSTLRKPIPVAALKSPTPIVAKEDNAVNLSVFAAATVGTGAVHDGDAAAKVQQALAAPGLQDVEADVRMEEDASETKAANLLASFSFAAPKISLTNSASTPVSSPFAVGTLASGAGNGASSFSLFGKNMCGGFPVISAPSSAQLSSTSLFDGKKQLPTFSFASNTASVNPGVKPQGFGTFSSFGQFGATQQQGNVGGFQGTGGFGSSASPAFGSNPVFGGPAMFGPGLASTTSVFGGKGPCIPTSVAPSAFNA